MLGVIGVEQRQPEVEVSLSQRADGIRKAGRGDTLFGPFVPVPETQSLLEAEQGAREHLVPVLASGLFEILFGADGKRDTLRVGLILADGVLKVGHLCVPVFRLRGHRLKRDREQLARLFGGLNVVPGGGHQAFHHVLARVRRAAGDDLVKDRTQEVDIRGEAYPPDRSGGHFRGHVGGRAAHADLRVDRRHRERKPPVHQQDLAEIAEHDVFRFEVSVYHASRVRHGDGVGDLHQDFQVLLERFLLDHRIPGRAFDAFHGVKERALLVFAQVVDGNDVGMFQVAGHHRF